MFGLMTLADEISSCMTAGRVRPLTSHRTSSIADRPIEEATPGMRILGPVAPGRSTSQATVVSLSCWKTEFTPRTEFGRRLCALRNKAIAAGMKLLSAEEVLEEVKRRRGEINADETNLH
jgi:hypothetical protein